VQRLQTAEIARFAKIRKERRKRQKFPRFYRGEVNWVGKTTQGVWFSEGTSTATPKKYDIHGGKPASF